MGWIQESQIDIDSNTGGLDNGTGKNGWLAYSMVVVDETSSPFTAADTEAGFSGGSIALLVTAVQHVRTVEYRGLSKEAADRLAGLTGIKGGSARNRVVFNYDSGGVPSYAVPALTGWTRTCAVRRANEAGAHTVTVTETTVATSGNVTVITGNATSGDVTAAWGAAATGGN